jgi:hypothetical protein
LPGPNPSWCDEFTFSLNGDEAHIPSLTLTLELRQTFGVTVVSTSGLAPGTAAYCAIDVGGNDRQQTATVTAADDAVWTVLSVRRCVARGLRDWADALRRRRGALVLALPLA